ncbi:MAG: TIM barrel protein [Armatimonadota bacterium]|nr:TIM barrel protein [Armatimonadota bacterium]
MNHMEEQSESHESGLSRRRLLGTAVGVAAGVGAMAAMKWSHVAHAEAAKPAEGSQEKVVKNGRLNQSVCLWSSKLSLEQCAAEGAKMGLKGIDLVGPDAWPTLKKYGLVCTLASNPTIDGLGGIAKAWNRVEHHDKLVQAYEDMINKVADAGYQDLICFSGNRAADLDDETGLKNCALGLKRIMKLAEEKKVTICMELLNSKLNHKDYMCDRTHWGVALVKEVGSERFKLLYDIYHMQVQEGDVIATIKQYKDYISHYHTAGVPGRNEIDDSQELNYEPIARAILDTGFTGYFAHEFIPKRDPVASLAQAAQICDV